MRRGVLAVAVFAALVGAGPALAEETPAATTPQAAPAQAAVRPGTRALFRLRDGGTIFGTFLSTGPEGDVVELTSGARVRLASGAVVGVEQAEGFDFIAAGDDAAPQRYAAVPSALLLKGRSWQVGMRTGEELGLDVGITSWLSVGVSSHLAVLRPRGQPDAYSGRVLAGLPLGEALRVAGGLRASSSGGATLLSFFGSATWGGPDANLTLHLGPPPLVSIGATRLREPAGALAFALRPGRAATFFAEAWVGRGPRSGLAFRAAGGGRLSAKGLALDLGLAVGGAGGLEPVIAATWTQEARP